MTINQATDYAFRAVLYLAKHPEEVVEAQVIADREVIPMRFLLKIMPSLIKAGIIRSYRGAGGGYSLAKKPQDITFLDVLEAIEGPVRLNRCLFDHSYCSKKAATACDIHNVLGSVQEKLRQELQSHKFSDLLLNDQANSNLTMQLNNATKP